MMWRALRRAGAAVGHGCQRRRGPRQSNSNACSLQVVFDHPGVGTKTLPCAARSELPDEEGNTVVIEITDALVHLTPAR